jgi:hypothetical protein
MAQIIRNQSAYPGFAPGLRMLSGELVNSDTDAHDYTLETKCITVMFAVAFNSSSGATILPTIADSTVNLGTKKATITVPLSGECRYLIVGVGEDLVDDSVTISDDTVSTYVD